MLAPLLLLGLGTALLSVLVVPGPLVNDIRAQLEEAEMPAEQMAVVVQKMSGSWGYGSAAIPPTVALAVAFALAGSLALLLMITRAVRQGPRTRYRTLLSLTAHVGLIDLLEFTVKLPLIFSKGTLHVYSSLALFLPEEAAGTRLFQLLNAVDAFTVWKLVLLTAGVAIVAERSRQESAAIVWLPWIAFVLARVALHGAFSPGVGLA